MDNIKETIKALKEGNQNFFMAGQTDSVAHDFIYGGLLVLEEELEKKSEAYKTLGIYTILDEILFEHFNKGVSADDTIEKIHVIKCGLKVGMDYKKKQAMKEGE